MGPTPLTDPLRQLEVVCNNTTAALFITDAEQQCVYLNPAAEELTGYTLADFRGKPFHDVVHHVRPDGRPYPRAECPIHGALPRNNQEQGEEVFVRPDGTFYPVAYTASPIREGDRPIGTVIELRDITEEKRTEAERLLRQTLLDRVLHELPVGVGITDAAGRTLWLNRAALELHGFDSTDDVLSRLEQYRDEFVFRYPDGRAMPFEEWPSPRAIRGETVEDYVVRLQRRGTGERIVSYTAVPVRGAAGAVEQLVFVMYDITDRERAEDALRRSEAVHRATVEVMAEAVIVLDAAGQVVTLNPAFARMHGYASLAEAFASLWHFDEHIEAFDMDGRFIPHGEWPAEQARRGESVFGWTLRACNRVTGHSFVGSYSSAPVYADGELAYVVVTIHDLSEVIAAQEVQRRQAQLLDTVEQAVVVTDITGTITYWNDFAARLYGWSAAEVVGRNIMEVTPSSSSREQAEQVMDLLRSGRSWSGELEVRRRDGTLFPAWVTDTPIRDDSGKVTGIIGISVDLTGRRQVEDALRRTEARLREQVAELAEADRRKDEFLAMLAHELRNPLSPISAAASILAIQGREDPALLRQCAVINRQIGNMRRLLDDLLDVSRVTRGMAELRKERLDLRTVVTYALEACRLAIEERHHHLVLSLTPMPLPLEADRLRLEQIVMNLLGNAAKYTDPGGTIWVSTAREGWEGGDEAVLTVRDSGVGISPDLLPHVFDLFTQEARSLARSEGGLGIGLTMVKRLAELHGGRVSARSEGKGRGAEFVVRLPLAAAVAHPAADARPATRGLNPDARRVLVVDDNHDAADTVADLCRVWGHEVRATYGGPAALELAALWAPEVVILDLGMPGLDGYEVARQLRDRSAETVMLIALTGYGQAEDLRRTQEAGFDAHLVKPIDPELLQRHLSDPSSSGRTR